MEESILKRIKEDKEVEKMKGEKGNNWQGGINPINDTIRKSLDTKDLARFGFIRDNYTCQKYGY